jgi:hypothetical protein
MNRRSRRTRSAGHFKNKTKKSASSAFFSRRWFRTDFTQNCFPQNYADEPQISQNTFGWAFQKQNKKNPRHPRHPRSIQKSASSASSAFLLKIRVIRVIRVPFKIRVPSKNPRSKSFSAVRIKIRVVSCTH